MEIESTLASLTPPADSRALGLLSAILRYRGNE